ncbi:hypothetical protein [Acinetobacter phage ABPH49]|nr:hypothetical protein [Acinetobacter phage ABPH49]
MPLNHITMDHVLGVTEYYANYNCKTPASPSADDLMSEIATIANNLDNADDLDDVHPLVKELNSLSAPDFSDFMEYHDKVYEKMDDFRHDVVCALEASGGLHEEPDLDELSLEQLKIMVTHMREELTRNLPYAMTVDSHIAAHKVAPLFVEVITSLGLRRCTMYPDLKRGEYQIMDPVQGIRAVWCGHGFYVYRNGCVLNLTEGKVGMQLPGDSGYLTIPIAEVKKIFVDWTKPTKEEGDLFQMIYPSHQYNLDKIFGDI